jgi:hypothetical protein
VATGELNPFLGGLSLFDLKETKIGRLLIKKDWKQKKAVWVVDGTILILGGLL